MDSFHSTCASSLTCRSGIEVEASSPWLKTTAQPPVSVVPDGRGVGGESGTGAGTLRSYCCDCAGREKGYIRHSTHHSVSKYMYIHTRKLYFKTLRSNTANDHAPTCTSNTHIFQLDTLRNTKHHNTAQLTRQSFYTSHEIIPQVRLN